MLNRSASLDAMFQALADPARQHLGVLEASGLVVTEKVGRARICRIEPRMLAAAQGWIAERMAWERRFGKLGQCSPDRRAKKGSEK